MPPKRTSAGAHGRPKGSKKKPSPAAAESPGSSNPFESSDDHQAAQDASRGQETDAEEPEKSIPKDLLTRILHEFFVKDTTRISRDANAAVGQYVDVFVREAIARAAMERRGGFLEVEDLEKIAPQLLLDL